MQNLFFLSATKQVGQFTDTDPLIYLFTKKIKDPLRYQESPSESLGIYQF